MTSHEGRVGGLTYFHLKVCFGAPLQNLSTRFLDRLDRFFLVFQSRPSGSPFAQSQEVLGVGRSSNHSLHLFESGCEGSAKHYFCTKDWPFRVKAIVYFAEASLILLTHLALKRSAHWQDVIHLATSSLPHVSSNRK